MKFLGYICVLVVSCYVLDFCKKLLDNFLGFLLNGKCLDKDFGCGVLVFGCLRLVFCVLGLVMLFGVGLRVLGIGWEYWGFSQFLWVFGGVSSEMRGGVGREYSDIRRETEKQKRNGFGSKNGLKGNVNAKILSCKCGWLSSFIKTHKVFIENLDVDDDEYDEGKKEEFDGVELRKMLDIEKDRANVAYVELEKERMAAKTAAEETMAMILRLQNEKSLVEMEAKQYKRLAEEKQLHDQEVIEALRWIVMKHESERSRLEDEVRLLKWKLKRYLEDDEGDQSEGVESADESLSFYSAESEDEFEDGLVSSLDIGL